MKPVLRLFALAALPALLSTTTVLYRPGPPTTFAAGDSRAPVIAVAATAQLRARATRTAVTVIVAAGSSPGENGSRVAAVRAAIGAAAPGAKTFERAFNTTTFPGTLGPAPDGGHVGVVIPGAAAAAARTVANAIRPFGFARIRGVESEPADCAAGQTAADARARAVARMLAAAGAAALGLHLGAVTASADRTSSGNQLDSSELCSGDENVRYPLESGAVPDDRSTLRASFALAFRAVADRSPLRSVDVASDVDSEPALGRWFPRDVELVVRERAMTIVGTANAPVAYAGDLVMYPSATKDEAMRDRVRALGLSDVRWYVAGDGQAVLAVRVPRNGAVKADDVVRVMRAVAGDRARNVGSTPYAECTRRDVELVTAAARDARRRAELISRALHVTFAAPAAMLVTGPASYAGCTPPDAGMHRQYTPAARWLSGAPERYATRTVVVAVTYPLQPVTPLPPAQAETQTPPPEDDATGRGPEDLTPPVRPAHVTEVATTTASQTLAVRRVDLEIGDDPDAANAYRAIDPAAVALAVAPWIAGAGVERTHVITQQRRTPEEHDDVAIGFRVDPIPPGFADQTQVNGVVARLGALGNPTVQYVARAATCRAASDAATVDAVRRALAGGGPPPSAILVGGPIVRHGACGESIGAPDYAWSNHAVDATVRIEVTARVFR